MAQSVAAPNPNTPQSQADTDGALNIIICSLIADEMEIIRASLEDIGSQLCTNSIVAREFNEALQNIDTLAQKNENLARVLRSREMEPVIDMITLDCLRDRLLDGVAHALADIENDGSGKTSTIWNHF